MQKAALLRQLETAFRGSRFHSFLGSLKGVTDEEARWLPPHYQGFAHMTGSILNLSYHTGGDKHVLMSHSFGDASVGWDVIQAQFEADGGDLAAARRLAESGHALVIETIQSLGDSDLLEERPYYGGKRLPAWEVFSIVAEHDVYHAGQIQFVRNLLRGR